MSSTLEALIRKNSVKFVPKESYLTLTRKNGQEVVTVVNKTVVITNLLKGDVEESSIKLDKQVPFEPLAMIMNLSEECLCLYSEKEIAMTFLKPIGSKITTNSVTNIHLDESIIQVVFNNVSKFQTEIVVLTNKSIQTFDINHSNVSPVQTYPLISGSKFNSSFYSSDSTTTIVDPVSICFQPSEDPKGDLTLMLLTADSSLYSIYPFFPNELSVSDEWLTQFSTYNSLLVQSTQNPENYSKYTTGFKIASLLQQNQKSCIISKVLPEKYQKGKVSGPLVITPFPDELYEFDARKIIPLKDDIISVLFDGCIIALNYQSSDLMTFHGQSFESDDKFLLIDAQILDSKKFGKLIDATSHPVSKDSVFAITNDDKDYKLFEVDYSKWLPLLTNDREDEFIEVVKQGIPTTVLHLDDIFIPSRNCKIGESSKAGLIGESNQQNIGTVFTLAERNCNKLTFIWNSRSVYLITLNEPDGTNITLVSALAEYNRNDDKLDQPAEQEDKVSDDLKYKTKLPKSDGLIPEIKRAKTILNELLSSLNTIKPRVLDIDEADVEDLQTILDIADLTTKGQLVLFKTLACLSNRLRDMSLEYHQQINGMHTLLMKKKITLQTCKENKSKFEKLMEKQMDLKEKYGKLNGGINNMYNSIRCEYLSISKEERIYFNELQKMDILVKEKTKQEEEIRQMLQKLENAELNSIAEGCNNIMDDPQSQLKLGLLKKNLEDKGQFINYLKNVVDNITV